MTGDSKFICPGCEVCLRRFGDTYHGIVTDVAGGRTTIRWTSVHYPHTWTDFSWSFLSIENDSGFMIANSAGHEL